MTVTTAKTEKSTKEEIGIPAAAFPYICLLVMGIMNLLGAVWLDEDSMPTKLISMMARDAQKPKLWLYLGFVVVFLLLVDNSAEGVGKDRVVASTHSAFVALIISYLAHADEVFLTFFVIWYANYWRLH